MKSMSVEIRRRARRPSEWIIRFFGVQEEPRQTRNGVRERLEKKKGDSAARKPKTGARIPAAGKPKWSREGGRIYRVRHGV